jgi:hypothetical protein
LQVRIESGPLNERMDIRLDEILPDQNLLGIPFTEVRHIIPEFLEGFQSAADVFRLRTNEEIYVKGGPGIPVDRKS